MREVPARLVVKLTAQAMRTPDGAQMQDVRARALEECQRLVPGELTPYFEQEPGLRAAAVAPFNRYAVAELPDRERAEAVAGELRELEVVDEAYVEAGPVEPPAVQPLDDPRSVNQGYLDAAPAGVDARWAWSMTDGRDVGFVDLEQGWTLEHEDLADAAIALISGVNQAHHDHGTNVLGVVAAVDNERGGVGIAPRAAARVVSQWRAATSYGTAAAILSAGQAMSVGDVLLLEAQTVYGPWDLVPVEVEPAVFDAIRHVTDEGIVVVEAAGNGGHDLDKFDTTLLGGKRVLNRDSRYFRDSGAIMVGAATSSHPHSRLDFSCHGSRVDCFAWGQHVDTTSSAGPSTTEYTSSFGGTSSASAIVAGAAVLLQSWRKRRTGKPYSPDVLRDLLSSNLNTVSADPAKDRIGVMPDLRAIIECVVRAERWKPFDDKNHLALVHILFGIIDDTPGVVWVPGKGPVPVDPEWLATLTASMHRAVDRMTPEV